MSKKEEGMSGEQLQASLLRCSASDVEVVEAMFASTGSMSTAATFDEEQLAGRIRFLMREKHGTPFEHNLFVFHVRAPIFVLRQWQRHRVGWSYSEMSGRYVDLPDETYMPADAESWFYEGKPGRAHRREVSRFRGWSAKTVFGVATWFTGRVYQFLLWLGVHAEVARMVLPLAQITEMVATCNARSLMHFLSLRRNHEDNLVPTFPQKEIDLLAGQMETVFAEAMPLTHKAFLANGRVAP